MLWIIYTEKKRFVFRTIYEKLSEAVSDESKETYLQRCQEISPNIRYCEYNIGDKSAADDLIRMRMEVGREDPMTSRLDVSFIVGIISTLWCWLMFDLFLRLWFLVRLSAIELLLVSSLYVERCPHEVLLMTKWVLPIEGWDLRMELSD